MKIINVRLPNDPPEFAVESEPVKDGVKIKVTASYRLVAMPSYSPMAKD